MKTNKVKGRMNSQFTFCSFIRHHCLLIRFLFIQPFTFCSFIQHSINSINSPNLSHSTPLIRPTLHPFKLTHTGVPSCIERKGRMSRIKGQHRLVNQVLVCSSTLELSDVLMIGNTVGVANVWSAHIEKVWSLSSDRVLGYVHHQLIETHSDKEVA